MKVPEAAKKTINNVVECLSEKYILEQIEWETLKYFRDLQIQPQQKQDDDDDDDDDNKQDEEGDVSIRYRLAEICNLMQEESWTLLEDELDDLLDEFSSVKIKLSLKTLVKIQADKERLFNLHPNNIEELIDFRNQIEQDYNRSKYPALFDGWNKVIAAHVDKKKKKKQQQRNNDDDTKWEKYFSSIYCKKRITQWFHSTLKTLEPITMTLFGLDHYFQSLQTTTTTNQLSRARHRLAALSKPDPINKAMEMAQIANATRNFNRKKSAHRIEFEDSSEEDDEDDDLFSDDDDDGNDNNVDKGPITLTSVPARYSRRKQRPRRPSQRGDDDNDIIVNNNNNNDGNKKRKREPWTDEQKQTLQQGVNDYGVGNWAQILKRYPSVFAGRTSVNLKDLWRTMKRHGIAKDPMMQFLSPEDENDDKQQQDAENNVSQKKTKQGKKKKTSHRLKQANRKDDKDDDDDDE